MNGYSGFSAVFRGAHYILLLLLPSKNKTNRRSMSTQLILKHPSLSPTHGSSRTPASPSTTLINRWLSSLALRCVPFRSLKSTQQRSGCVAGDWAPPCSPCRRRRRSGAAWPPPTPSPSTTATSSSLSAAPRNPSSTSPPTSTPGPSIRLFPRLDSIRSGWIFFSGYAAVCC
jgi:hypothetical protein